MKSFKAVLLVQVLALSGCLNSSSISNPAARSPSGQPSPERGAAQSFFESSAQTISYSGSLPQSEVFGDFASDAQGFGRWTALNSQVTSRLLCRNGTVEAVRDCNDPGNPGACIGPIRKIASCSEFGIEKEKFSAWGAWKPAGECLNGSRNFTRSCFSLDGQEPICYGAASAMLPCNVEPNAKFKRMGECVAPPASYAFDQFYTGCGGVRFYYNGVRTNQDGCFIDANGGIDCGQAVSQVEYCIRPGTSCTASLTASPAGFVPGTVFQTPTGSTCGISLNSIVNESNKLSNFEIVEHNEISSYALQCGARNHVVKARTCMRNTEISDCVLDIQDVIAGKQNDTSCEGIVTSQIESCSYSSVANGYLQQLRRNGQWSSWQQASGCAFIPSLNKIARLETRSCGSIGNLNTELDGVFCEGEKSRFVECSGVLEGNHLAVFASGGLGAGVLSQLNQYADVIRGRGADVAVVSRDSGQSVVELRNFISSYTLPSGFKPNEVLFVGAFPYAQVRALNASNEMGDIYSDLPLSAPISHYMRQADGVYTLSDSLVNQKVVLERIVFRIDFSNHNVVTAEYPNVVSKYSAFIGRMIQKHQNAVSAITENRRAKLNELVDGFWDHQPFHISNNKADTTAYIGTSRSGRGGLMELMGRPGDIAIIMAHGNGSMIGLGGKSYLPSNDSLDQTIHSTGADSILGGVPVRSSHLNLFSCHSGDPSVSNNVMSSSLLNPQGSVVSVVASTTSGAFDNWTGYSALNKIALGHTVGHAYLSWFNSNAYGKVLVPGPYGHEATQSMGPQWFTGLIFAGDPVSIATDRKGE